MWEDLLTIGRGRGKEFRSGNLPFSVKIDSFLRNAEPVSATNSKAIDREVHAIKLKPLKIDPKVEKNSPGCFASVMKGSDKLNEFILSGYSTSLIPGRGSKVAGFTVDGKQYGLQLVKKNWQLPYLSLIHI